MTISTAVFVGDSARSQSLKRASVMDMDISVGSVNTNPSGLKGF